MKTVQNEKGYTLLLTLVIIFIIIIFFSSFSLSAMNQQKQVEKTDENYEVTAIAEMGVEYYQASILNLIAEYQNPNEGKGRDITQATVIKLNSYIKANEDNKKNGNPPNYSTEEIEGLIAYPISELKKDIKKLFKKDVVTVSNNSFKITKDLSNVDGPWTVEVTGYSEGKLKTISATFKLPEDFDLVVKTPNNPVSITSHLVTPPPFPSTTFDNNTVAKCSNLIPQSNSNNICYSNTIQDSLKNLENLELYYTNTIMSNLNQSLDSLKKLYVNNDLTVSGSFNLTNSSELYINGKATFSNSFNHGTDATIYSKGDLTLGGSDSKNLKLYTLGKFIFTDPKSFDNVTLYANDISPVSFNDFKNNSKLQINNSASFAQINNFSNSNILVKGTATFTSLNKDSVKLDNSTMTVEEIKFTTTSNTNIILLANSSKLCVKSLSSDDRKKIQPTDHSEVITINNSLADDQKSGSGHDFQYNEKTFNKVCGITSSSSNTTTDTYNVNTGYLHSEENITSGIEYK